MNSEEQHLPVPPPPAASAPAPGSAFASPPSSNGGGRVAVILTAVVGGLALLFAGGTAAAAAVNDLTRSADERTADADGVTRLDLEAGASDVAVRFGDVDEAVLTVSGSRGDWTLDRDGDELVVRSPRTPFGWWLGGSWFSDEERVLLTLPEQLESDGLDADLALTAGSLDVTGVFDDLEVTVSAGSFTMEGAARTLGTRMNAGHAELELLGVTEADLSVAAGDLYVSLNGDAPDRVGIDVNAGDLDLTLPDVEYRVNPRVSAGEVDDQLARSSSSRHVVDVTVSAGSVTLRPGD